VHVLIDASGMLIAPRSANPMERVGDTFLMDMDGPARGYPHIETYAVENIVTRFVQDRQLEWGVGVPGQERPGHVYGYRLTPTDRGSVDVAHYCDWTAVPERLRVALGIPVVSTDGLARSLENLRRLAVGGS
jgi:hypothetical protein